MIWRKREGDPTRTGLNWDWCHGLELILFFRIAGYYYRWRVRFRSRARGGTIYNGWSRHYVQSMAERTGGRAAYGRVR